MYTVLNYILVGCPWRSLSTLITVSVKKDTAHKV